MSPTDSSNEIKEYLLGSLSQEARQRVETRLMTEEEFFEELLLGEDELIDGYVGGSLAPDERDRFESHFLSTDERHEKLRFGRALGRYISERPGGPAVEAAETRTPADAAQPPAAGLTWAERLSAFWRGRTWGLQAGLALAVVVVIVGAVWLARPRVREPRTFHTLALIVSANNRGEGVEPGRVTLPLDADALRISLTLPARQSPSALYRVELVGDDGEARPLEVVGRDAESVSVVIPAAELSRGQYTLNLFTAGTDGAGQRVPGSYFFNVE